MPESRNCLVGIRVKKTVKVDVRGPLMSYIKRVYGAHMAEEAEENLTAIQELRNQIVGSGIGMDHFAKYYGALRAIEIRFPVSSDNSHANINFKWHDAFRDTQTCSQKNVHFEVAAVIFCMAAISSQKGLDISRKTEQGISEAVKSFNLAAGLLKFLREEVTLKTETPRPVDISGECCTMLESLMLAQAQEMFYELMHAKRTASPGSFTYSLLAQVASGTAEMYADVTEKYSKPALMKHFDKEWIESSRVKSVLYTAEAQYLLALHLQPQAGATFGEYLGRLRMANSLLEQKQKESKLASSNLQAQYKEMMARVASQLEVAEREQRRIYMQLIPKDVSPITPRKMVQSKDPAEVINRPEEWFGDIVPDKVTRNLSKYTSQMEEVVRELLHKVDGATDDARTALVAHGLPGILDSLTPGKQPELPERAQIALAEDFVTKGPASQLQGACSNLSALRDEASSSLNQCTAVLDEEEQSDSHMRNLYGDAWTRPVSNVLNASLRETVARYRSNLQTAGESDARVMARLQSNRGRLESLSAEGAKALMPVLQQPIITTDADPATVTQTLRGSMAALDTLSNGRAALESKIKAAKEADNILPELLKCGSDGAEDVFKAHLAMYEPVRREVEQNLSQQEQLLTVISSNMAAFKAIYDIDGWQSECNSISDMVVSDVRLGTELLSQLNEGIVWYSGIQESIVKLRQMCSDFVMTRNIQLKELEDEIQQRQQREKASAANEEAARRLQQMDMNATGASDISSAPAPATYAEHPTASAPPPAVQPPQQYPAPPIGPAVPSPYLAYTPAQNHQNLFPQLPQPPPPQGYTHPPAPPPSYQAQPPPPQPPYGSSHPYSLPSAPYGPGQAAYPPSQAPYSQPAPYYNPQSYPQAPYSQPHPGPPR